MEPRVWSDCLLSGVAKMALENGPVNKVISKK